MRRKTLTDTDQLDFFTSAQPETLTQLRHAVPMTPDRPTAPINAKNADPTTCLTTGPSAEFLPDEWWTTKMVCSFLKISRKTLWERRRNRTLGFPRPALLGGGRNLYRAAAIKTWAETIALAQRNDRS